MSDESNVATDSNLVSKIQEVAVEEVVNNEANVSPVPDKKRTYVIQEIISTEATYLQRLKFAIDYVIKPLKESKILSEEDVVKQFTCLEAIYQLHSSNSIDGSASQNLKFVQLFDAIGHNVQCYSDYLVNYEPAMQRRAHLLTYNRKFADFIAKIEKEPHLQNQKIESLLILPVQRIPRYRLLLEQLLKYTPEDHVDHPIVKDALQKICELAMYNNEAIRARENLNKMMEIMLSIEPTSRVDLLAEKDRRFIREAPLLKQCRRKYKEFQFWLFTDYLMYGEMTPIGLYTLNRQIPLARCKITELDSSDPEHKVAFILESPAKSFKIKAKDEFERKEWLEIVRDAVEKQKTLYNNEKDNVAPVWRPDSNSDNCEMCDAVFTLIFRRHHCRNCGILVCDNCSSKRLIIPHVDEKKPVRVCDSCYDLLNSAGTSNKQMTSNATDTSEDVDDEYWTERRESLTEDHLQDFNDFMVQNQGDEPTGVVLPPTILISMQHNSPPPKPPKPRSTNVNFSGDVSPGTDQSNAGNVRAPRHTVATSKPSGPKMAPRKSLLNSITSTVLKPTGLLTSLVSSLGSPTSQSSATTTEKPVTPKASEEASPKPLSSPGGSGTSPDSSNRTTSEEKAPPPRRPRRTNIILQPNPVLAELNAKIESKRKSDDEEEN